MTRIVARLFLLVVMALHAPAFAMGGPSERVPLLQPTAPEGDPPELAPQSQQIVRMEEGVRRRINDERRERGLEPLTPSDELARVARDYSRRMSAEGFFSHIDPDGGTMEERLRAAGIRYRMAGENISMSVNAPDPVDVAVRGWMKSPGHRENILRDEFTETGVGIWQDGNTYHFTQIFMRPF